MAETELPQEKKQTRVDRLIQEAFAQLLEEKAFSEIRVSDIVRRADISRSAFYTHYEDKYDLIDRIEQSLIDGFMTLMKKVREDGLEYRIVSDEQEITGGVERGYFDFIQTNQRYWRLFMTGHGKADFLQRFTHRIFLQFKGTAELWKDPADPIIPQPVGLTISSWAYVGLISYWLETGMEIPPQEMGRYVATYWFRFKQWLRGQPDSEDAD